MREIRDVIEFVQESTLKRFPLVEIPGQEPTLEDQLYDLIAQNKVPSDKDASIELYGEYPNDSFSALKYRLIQRLYNHLYFVDLEKIEDRLHHKEEVKATDYYLKGVVLQKLNKLTEASEFFYKSYRIAEKLDLTELKVINLRYLLNNTLQNRDLKEFEEYEKQLAKYEQVLRDELEAHRLYCKIEMQLLQPMSKRKSVVDNIKKQLQRIKQLLDKAGSHAIFEAYYGLSLRLYELTSKYDKIVELTEEAEEMWRKGKINEKQFDHEVNKILAIKAHIRSDQVKKGVKVAEQHLNYFKEGEPSWFVFCINLVVLEAHDKNFIKAYRVLENALRHKGFSKQPKAVLEQYALVQGFLDVITNQHLNESFFEQFEDMQETSKEERLKDLRVDLRLLYFIFLLQNKEYDKIEEEADILTNYSSKYLRIKGYKRLKNIINLLTSIPKYNFNWSMVKDRGRYLFNNLQGLSKSDEVMAEVEMVPYEAVWDWALDLLRTEYTEKRPKRKSRKTKAKG